MANWILYEYDVVNVGSSIVKRRIIFLGDFVEVGEDTRQPPLKAPCPGSQPCPGPVPPFQPQLPPPLIPPIMIILLSP